MTIEIGENAMTVIGWIIAGLVFAIIWRGDK